MHITSTLFSAAFVLLLGSPLALASELTGEPRHAIQVGLGAKMDAIREDLVVPLTFYGPGFRVLLGYQGTVGPGVLSCRADFGMSFLHNRFGHGAMKVDYGAEAVWTTRIVQGLGWHLSLGASLVLDSRVYVLYSWDDSHDYWVGTEVLGPALRHRARLGQNWRIESSMSVALLGLLGRPPAYRTNKQDAMNRPGYYFEKPWGSQRVVGPQNLQAVRLGVALTRVPYDSGEVGRGWSFGIDLRFLRTDQVATNMDISAVAYAAHAWGW